MKHPLFLFAALALAGCATTQPQGDNRLAYARMGQTVSVGGARVTPLALIEDSRCPQGVQCVWAGQVRITARVATRSGSAVRELTTGKPIPVANGTLTLANVEPTKRKDTTVAPGDFRFGFRFDGKP